MAQLKKKFLGNDQVGATKILLENNSYIRGRNAADSADINTMKVNASDVIEFASVPQVNADAAVANDLVRYSQVVSLFQAEKPKAAVATVSLIDIDLAAAVNPNPVGAHTITNGQRVLLAGQTASEKNGIYIAVTAADPTTWTRSLDMDLVSEIPGAYTVVQFGSSVGEIYVTTSSPATLNTDPIVFVKKAAPTLVNHVEELLVLNGTDITNQYKDLANAGVSAASISMFVLGGPIQEKAVDYSIALTGGVAGVTRISFLADLATAGLSALISGDKLAIRYSYV